MRRRFAVTAVCGVLALTLALAGCDTARPSARAAESETVAAPDETPELVPLEITLPRPRICGPVRIGPPGFDTSRIKRSDGKPRPALMVPAGTRNVSSGKPVSASDVRPIIGDVEQITDGDKEAGGGSYVELGPGTQHVTIDLEGEHEIRAIVVWHCHGEVRVCRDVIVRIADDPECIMGVSTLFNNDHDNSSGLGIGKDYEYFETREGLLVEAGGARARYVRLYSNGSNADEMNRYAEVEVYGKPVSE
ncbi:MAG: hypothetical protein ACYS9X_15070 [Planctomycetota bacterium]|jgi:hypothetical protein